MRSKCKYAHKGTTPRGANENNDGVDWANEFLQRMARYSATRYFARVVEDEKKAKAEAREADENEPPRAGEA